MEGVRGVAKGVYQEWTQGEGLERVRQWVANGMEDKWIADQIGIGRTTIYAWRKSYPDFEDAFKSGRTVWFETSLSDVENAAYKLATGYSYKETTQELREIEGEMKLVVTKVVTKHQAPNPVSNMYWLQNRAPEKWKDRRNMQPADDESGETGVVAIAEVKCDA